jgi:excinuclease ABC subunit C
MMREMLRRRFARLVKENPREPSHGLRGEDGSNETAPGEGLASGKPPLAHAADPVSDNGPPPPAGGEREDDPDAFPAWPDLVLIDGGKGQLAAARAALAEIGVVDVPLVGVAKGRDRDAGRETFFVEGKAPIHLPPRDPALYFVQRLRDEAHRFAIGTHRARRKSNMTKSGLDEIPGIGPSRKRALLQHFGTMKAVSSAALDDLIRTPGVNAATAKAVYDYFHDGG